MFLHPPPQISKLNLPSFQVTFGLAPNPGCSGSEHEKSYFVFSTKSWVDPLSSRCLVGELGMFDLTEAARSFSALSHFAFSVDW